MISSPPHLPNLRFLVNKERPGFPFLCSESEVAATPSLIVYYKVCHATHSYDPFPSTYFLLIDANRVIPISFIYLASRLSNDVLYDYIIMLRVEVYNVIFYILTAFVLCGISISIFCPGQKAAVFTFYCTVQYQSPLLPP